MSDAHKDHQAHSGPGHEVDAPPTKELFNIVWGLGGLTLLSIVTCAQLFYQQERDISAERAKETSYQLAEYRKEMTDRANGSGVVEFKDSGGKTVRQKFRPIALAREDVLSRPERLKAAAPPAGWVHPDDIAAGGQGGAPPPPADPGAGAPTPAGVQPPAGATPTDAPAGTAPNHPLGEPAVLPPGTGPANPTSAEPIRPAPVAPPPPTPAAPAPVAPTPAAPAPAAPHPAPAK